MNPQTVTIGINLLLSCGFIVFFAGACIGYVIGWRQRRSQPVPPAVSPYHFDGPIDLDEFAALRDRALRDSAEQRVRRSQA